MVEQPALDLEGDEYLGWRWFVRNPTEPHVCTPFCGQEPPPAWHEVTRERYQWEAVKGAGPGVVRKDGTAPPADLIWLPEPYHSLMYRPEQG